MPGSSITLERNPLYYGYSPVDPVTEGDPVGVQFLAVAPSTQLSPAKITDSATGVGAAHIIVPLQNHGKTDSAESTFTVTLTKLAGPGTDQTLTNSTTITINYGTSAVAFDETRDLAKGKYSIDVIVDTTYQGRSFHYEYHKIVYVTVQGDLNEDGVVDIIDIVIVAGHFGSQISQYNYDPGSDVNHDGVVDVLDIVKVAGVYGYTYIV